jgi:hypothetical protein
LTTGVPRQPHCQLTLQPPQDVSREVAELLRVAAERRKAKARTMNTTTSTTSSRSTHLSVQSYGRPQLYNWRNKGQ